MIWASAAAACLADPSVPQARTVLGLYDGRQESEPRDTRLHQFLEFPLNHLGYVINYQDISEGLPPDELDSDVAAVATWFLTPPANRLDYERWAAGAESECGTPVRWLVLGDPGTELHGASSPDRTAFLGYLGLEDGGDETLIGSFATVLDIDPDLLDYESEFLIEPDVYRSTRALPDAQSHLRIAPREDADNQGIDLVVTGPRGAFVHGSASIAFDRRSGQTFWIIDPFKLLAFVLDTRTHPIPDVTTLNGRRIFFSTVGSEGWLDVAPGLDFGQDLQVGAEILRDRVITPFADLPQTVAVLNGDFDPTLSERAAALGKAVAAQLFELPQVMIASNGESMIRTWQFFSTYDRGTETRQIDEFNASDAGDDVAGLFNVAVKNLGGAFANPGGGATPNAPRKYTSAVFELDREIVGALTAAAELVPGGRDASLFEWSGDARPFEGALAAAREAGYPAIGGGGGVYNTFSPSISNLSPFSAPVGKEMQVYDGLSGDSAYTGYWTTPLFGFHALHGTLNATESPRRMKPFHLKYSARSMIDFGTRSAVQDALEMARAESFIPIVAAEYVRTVEGFLTARVVQEGDKAWRIVNRGALQTIRFDDAEALALDMDASEGVLGARRKDASLYVALLPSATEPVIVLTESADAPMVRSADRFALREGRLTITDMSREPCNVRLTAHGWGPGRMIWEGPPGKSYVMRVVDETGSGGMLQEVNVVSDGNGVLDLALPPLGGQTLGISLAGGC